MFSLFQKGVGGGNGEQVAFLSHLIILVITLLVFLLLCEVSGLRRWQMKPRQGGMRGKKL